MSKRDYAQVIIAARVVQARAGEGALRERIEALAAEMDDPNTEHGTMPGVRMQVRHHWAARLRALVALDPRAVGQAIKADNDEDDRQDYRAALAATPGDPLVTALAEAAMSAATNAADCRVVAIIDAEIARANASGLQWSANEIRDRLPTCSPGLVRRGYLWSGQPTVNDLPQLWYVKCLTGHPLTCATCGRRFVNAQALSGHLSPRRPDSRPSPCREEP